MVKLVVMIPAYNEESSIASVIKEIPRNCCDVVEVLVIDDGSTDNTYKEARLAGADRIIKAKKNRGLAPSFREGLETALSMGADIIVNTDADCQYDGNDIPRLIEPILNGKADVVLGSRTLGTIEEMPLTKKIGNRIATVVTSITCGRKISDAQTGFRAFSRDVALRLNVLSRYTYVQETLIQMSYMNIVMIEIPIVFRKRKGGQSRLISNVFNYAKRAGITILRTYLTYKPLEVFLSMATVFFIAGTATGSFVLVHYFQTGFVSPRIPTAILTVLLLVLGTQCVIIGLLGDMLRSHKMVQDETLYRLKKIDLGKKL